MASICTSNHPNFHFLCRNNPNSNPNPSSISHHHLLLAPSSLSFSRLRLCHCAAVKTGSESGGSRSDNAELLRKPVISTGLESSSSSAGEELVKEEESDDEVEKKNGDEQNWVDWEDQILEDTVPLVGFVRMILHSGKYAVGDRLSPDHQRTILQRLLPYHPECKEKIGSGVDYITVGYHPDFESSRCLFIVRKDGELVDFSYWKCIKGLIRKNYPLYADSFILRHFRRRRRND
ncbi:PREDICTED: protein DCL, chloroplastic [Nicotiana attenuata]|uniref:Protein dcl, chloroplastic n=1 Tax=Nicotiana attenuata TaxID=49451 RepID=A0A1J6IIK0_NICAT|nr:PREDICTED: protein DCL, chloroplastic [Nicotiana attenuata]OIT04172.1 protein dcl, chloroplastic [Nicotiana attenuata]